MIVTLTDSLNISIPLSVKVCNPQTGGGMQGVVLGAAGGSKFHRMGAAWRKALSPYGLSLVLGTHSRLLCQERRARPGCYHCSKLRRYCQFRVPHVQQLPSIRSLFGVRPERSRTQDFETL